MPYPMKTMNTPKPPSIAIFLIPNGLQLSPPAFALCHKPTKKPLYLMWKNPCLKDADHASWLFEKILVKPLIKTHKRKIRHKSPKPKSLWFEMNRSRSIQITIRLLLVPFINDMLSFIIVQEGCYFEDLRAFLNNGDVLIPTTLLCKWNAESRYRPHQKDRLFYQ